jgi:type IV pilus assembly protein PilC
MVQYQYTARDDSGEKVTGTQTANSPQELRVMLRRKHLFVVQIVERPTAPAARSRSRQRRSGRIKLNDLVVMSRQFATLIDAGMPVVQTLQSLVAQTENGMLAAILAQVQRDVSGGSSLQSALMRHPRVFNELFVAMIAAGELAGTLDETLEMAALQYEREADLRAKVTGAFIYPALVVFATAGVVAFLLIFVVPVFQHIYDQFHVQLPIATRLLISMSALLTRWTLPAMLGLAGAAAGFRRAIRTRRGRWYWDRFKLIVPLLGNLNRKVAVARFVRTLSAMVRGGVPLLKSLGVAANTSGNVIISAAVASVARSVRDGNRIWVPLEASGEFPPMVGRMVAAGEESGNLSLMLEKLAGFYEKDIDITVDRLTRVMEPLLTIVIGAVVLFVLVALYMPIYNLNNVMK